MHYLTLLAGTFSQLLAQAYTAVIVDQQRSFKVGAGQIMELLPIVGQPPAGAVRSEIKATTYTSKVDYATKAPAWRITFQGKNFASDSTDGYTSDSGSMSATTSSTTTRFSLPQSIVGPATLRLTPAKNSPFIFTYRLVANK